MARRTFGTHHYEAGQVVDCRVLYGKSPLDFFVQDVSTREL